MSGLQSTTYNGILANRADFKRHDFEQLIHEKGRRVIHEKVLQCGCKSRSTNQQSDCKNCGGSGWVFVNPIETRMILKGMKITPNYKSWSEELVGDLEVTASDTEELTVMDRITLPDGKAIYNEVLFFRSRTVSNVTTWFAFSSYNIKEVKYAGYFKGVDQPFQRLLPNTDFTFDGNIIILTNPAIVPVQDEISITLRYVHPPQYLMIDMKRESMESWEVNNGEKLINLPISGTARRQHYILNASNLNGDNILSNNYVEVETIAANECP